MQYQREDLAYFPYQIDYALYHYQPHQYKGHQFRNIIIGGLGGSGIAGHFVKHYLYDKATVPIEVISDYALPNYVNEDSLVILSSYSGNTEETIALAEMAKNKAATIMVITVGGQLAEMAKANDWLIFYPEPGFQPRMALGYSISYLLLVLNDCFELDLARLLSQIAHETKDTEAWIRKAKETFQALSSKVNHKFIALTDLKSFPIGLRFCQQMQENAKSEAFVHYIPEANHNVIESYNNDMRSVFLLFNTQESERVSLRFRFLKDLLEKNGNFVLEIPIIDASIQSILQTSFMMDWIALLTADQKGVHSLEIPNIKALKTALKKS